ncbi:MAG: hypothetical protein ACI9UJ_001053 [bacterium]|jgi:hypothetical protein
MFSTPRQEDIDRARRIFHFANDMHENKQYFETNPLDDLNFFIK